MAEVATLPQVKPERKRTTSQTKFAVYSLLDALQVAQVIHEKGGGVASNDQLAAYLGYRSSKNGAYLARVASARTFNLITGHGNEITITPRAQTILMPEYPEYARQALIEAFFDVPLFKAVYDEYLGKQLPPEFGMKNALRTRFGIAPSVVDSAYRSLMESADQAGFFATRGGRTQLIIPRIGQPAVGTAEGLTDKAERQVDAPASGGGEGGGGGHQPPPLAPRSREELQNEYVSTLIDLLRQSGQPDPDLMTKIESLLGMEEGSKRA